MPQSSAANAPLPADMPQTTLDRLRRMQAAGEITLVGTHDHALAEVMGARVQALSDRISALEATLVEELARSETEGAPALGPIVAALAEYRAELLVLCDRLLAEEARL